MRKPINNLHFHHGRLQQPSQQWSGEKNIRTNKMTQSDSFSYLHRLCTHIELDLEYFYRPVDCGAKNQERQGGEGNEIL